MDDEILNPKLIGDNTKTVALNKEYSLKFSYYQKKYYCLLLNQQKICFEWESNKNILKNTSIEKDIKNKINTLQILPDKNVTNTKLTEIYSQITPHFLDIETQNEENKTIPKTFSYKNINEEFISDTRLLSHKTKPTLGMIEINKQKHYYFGFNLIYPETYTTEKGELKNRNVAKTTLILDNHQNIVLTDEKKEQYKITVKEIPINKNPQWELTQIKNWLDNYNPPKINSKELFDRIKQKYKQYCYFQEEEYYDILSVWVLGTYLHQLFNMYPYYNLWGMKGTAKSKTMIVTQNLCFNGFKTTNITSAGLFRLSDQMSCTLFFDEAENLYREGNNEEESNEILCLVNSGAIKGDTVVRVNKETGKLEEYDPYCPKMFASIKGLKGALNDRCITHIMIKPPLNEGTVSVGDNWPDETDKDWQNIRNDIYCWSLQYWREIEMLYSNDLKGVFLEKEFSLNNRDWFMWKPLICICKIINQDIYQIVGKIAEKISNNKEEDYGDDSWNSKIYDSLIDWAPEKTEKCQIKDLMEEVKQHFVEKIFVDSYGHEQKTYKKEMPSSMYVVKFMNKIGFNIHKRRDMNKRYYWLNKTIVYGVLARCNDWSGEITEFLKNEVQKEYWKKVFLPK